LAHFCVGRILAAASLTELLEDNSIFNLNLGRRLI
jgi:hypothetical protein